MFTDIKGNISRETESLLYLLGYHAQKDGYRIYAVGSFMRDLLLGREKRNMKLLLDGEVQSYIQSLQRLTPYKIQYSKLLGTASLHFPGHYKIEIHTLKNEVNILSEEPASSHMSLKNELFREDFTINTLAMELNTCNFCKLYDFFGGRKDLEQGIIRVLYSLSFVNEPLLLLRALRLEQSYGFTLNGDTEKLMRTAIAGRIMQRSSREGISRELRSIFAEPAPSKILRRLYEIDLWKQVFPRLHYWQGMLDRLQLLEITRKKFEHLADQKAFRYNFFIIYLAVLLLDLSSHDLQYLSYMMRLKKKEKQDLAKTLDDLKLLRNNKVYSSTEAENIMIAAIEKRNKEEEGEKKQNVFI